MACCVCCGYPNGVAQVIAMQFLLFVGWAFSWAALVDCKFAKVTVPPGVGEPELLPLFPPTAVGFFMWEYDGSCQYDNVDDGDMFNAYYYDFLGSDWRVGRAFGIVAAVFGIAIWIWSLFLICIDFPKCLRYFKAFCLLLLVVFQGLTFLPYSSGFCNDFDCEFSVTAGLSVGATLSYFFCAVLCILMRETPEHVMSPTYGAEEKQVEEEVVVTKEEAEEEAVTPGEAAEQEEESPELEEPTDVGTPAEEVEVSIDSGEGEVKP